VRFLLFFLAVAFFGALALFFDGVLAILKVCLWTVLCKKEFGDGFVLDACFRLNSYFSEPMKYS
jgi:hypothetical protein